jgi:hypothetical protein
LRMSRAIPLFPLWALRGLLLGDLYLYLCSPCSRDATELQSARFPNVAFTCLLWCLKWLINIFLNSINRLIFVIERHHVYCEVNWNFECYVYHCFSTSGARPKPWK